MKDDRPVHPKDADHLALWQWRKDWLFPALARSTQNVETREDLCACGPWLHHWRWRKVTEERAVIERAISGALKCAIEAHGPITLNTRGSAAKRVYGALGALANDACGGEDKFGADRVVTALEAGRRGLKSNGSVGPEKPSRVPEGARIQTAGEHCDG